MNIYSNNAIDAASLIGETLASVDYFPEERKNCGDTSEQFLLTTISGRQIVITHIRDWGESVHVESTEGNWSEIVGKVIINANRRAVIIRRFNDGDEENKYDDRNEETYITFLVNDATLVQKWIGNSNGYYSTDANLYEVEREREQST